MREGYERYSSRDYGFVDELFAPDIVWRVPDADGTVLHGREAVHGFFQGLQQQFRAHRIECLDAVEQGDTLACLVRHTIERHDGGGGQVEAVHWWRWRDNQITSLDEVADTMAFAHAAGMLAGTGAAV